jgi:UDP-N-acetylglucosamine 4-epimerase
MTEQPTMRWLVTGAAGFIGSHLVQTLLATGHQVRGLDNFATGRRENLDDVLAAVGPDAARAFEFVEGDIRDLETCRAACVGVTHVLHQAALGSVPRSIADPIRTHESNVDGFLNILVAARDADVTRFVYASSSSVYGDHPALPKVEGVIGAPLSPYALSKRVNEEYARIFAARYGMSVTGLRYFNVFGPRQDPDGPYAAVIPKWIGALLNQESCTINGDGETSRDFCFVDNVVQANLLAASAPDSEVRGEVFNIACGDRTTLNELYASIAGHVADHCGKEVAPPTYAPPRDGDVQHSCADITKARTRLGYEPRVRVGEGLRRSVDWYRRRYDRTT